MGKTRILSKCPKLKIMGLKMLQSDEIAFAITCDNDIHHFTMSDVFKWYKDLFCSHGEFQVVLHPVIENLQKNITEGYIFCLPIVLKILHESSSGRECFYQDKGSIYFVLHTQHNVCSNTRALLLRIFSESVILFLPKWDYWERREFNGPRWGWNHLLRLFWKAAGLYVFLINWWGQRNLGLSRNANECRKWNTTMLPHQLVTEQPPYIVIGWIFKTCLEGVQLWLDYQRILVLHREQQLGKGICVNDHYMQHSVVI